MSKVRVLISKSYDPWFNLATEEWIFREMDPSVQTLFLWRNDNTVVIGRNQNPWSECNLAKMQNDDVKLARRTTGGGAVFQDLGNTCFTFLSPREGYDRSRNSSIIIDALKKFSISAEASGRNDLVIAFDDGPRKFSGSAFRETRDRAFHHGTILISANLSRLAEYLTPHPKKLQSKGRASVRARVMNLNEISSDLRYENLSPKIIESFCSNYDSTCVVEELDPEKIASLPRLKEHYEQMKSWEWRFGHAPNFQHQMNEYLSWGFVDVHIDAENAIMTRVAIFSDALLPGLVESLQQSLEGKAHSQKGVALAVDEACERHPELSLELNEFGVWMKEQVEI